MNKKRELYHKYICYYLYNILLENKENIEDESWLE